MHFLFVVLPVEGVWTKGEQTGKGTYYYANGDVFKGKWLCGKKHSRGIFTSGSENSSFLETWNNGVREDRQPCKFYPPRLLKTEHDAGMKVTDAAGEARAIRYEIGRLSQRLRLVQRGEQWQRHVQSTAFTNLVSRSTAALLSPQHTAPPTTEAKIEYTNSVPSPAAEIEAAAACNGTSTDGDQTMESNRPISPLTATLPTSDTLEGVIPHSASIDGGARASTPAPSVASPIPEAHLCKVCMTAEINTVLLPCAHLAVCMDCSTMLERCCICRASIDSAIQTFRC
ncbi:MAG: RING-HC finger protein [Candidatus Pacebacteria bacterium]|nr:RING-HC finger protein [Candidatus Paceibacterota bacterium]